MAETQDKILDSAERLIQSRGYSAISYQDISNEVGIRKASIHYYYSSKEDLVVALVKRYRQKLMQIMDRSAAARGEDAVGLLADYFAIYLIFEDMPDRVCLCGSLAGEYPALPEAAQLEVDEFFADHQAWLERVISTGQQQKLFHAETSAPVLAGWVLSALQGALLVGRATGAFQRMHETQAMLRGALLVDRLAPVA